MHIKQQPDDFHVEEVTDVAPGQDGDYALYRLEKEGWTTPDALQVVRRRWKLDGRRLSYGGLKDRHAHTVQYITIFHGPQRSLHHSSIQLHHLGQVARPFASSDIVANRFRLVVRDMSAAEVKLALVALNEVRQAGVPNYFDDQRFGSVADGGPFLARSIVLGEFEEALKLALAAPYRYDRAEAKREKAMLRNHWGDWPRLKNELPRGHARSLVDYLVTHPADFKGAVERLRPELRGLYLSAYQSHLWNRMLAHWLRAHLPADKLVNIPLRLGEVPMQRSLTDEQRAALESLELPLHSARFQFDEGDPRRPFFDRVLHDEGLTQDQLKLRGFREMFFSKGERRALLMPTGVEAEAGADEHQPGRRKLALRFELPRGAYATLIVKRVTRLGD